MRRNEAGFTALELTLTSIILIVLGVTSYFLGRISTNNKRVITPAATQSPTTLTISRNTEAGTSGTGFTVKVNDTNTAGAILDDIRKLPVATNTSKCPTNISDNYTFHFTDPDETYVASYGGCYLVTESGGKSNLMANPSTKLGASLWNEVNKATNHPL